MKTQQKKILPLKGKVMTLTSLKTVNTAQKMKFSIKDFFSGFGHIY